MKKQKIITVVSIVVVCALLFGAYALIRSAPVKEKEVPLPERVASTTVPFRTYTNQTAGVSFSIPADWEQAEGSQVRIESPDFVEETVPGTEGKRVIAGAAIFLEKEAYLVDNSEEYATLIEKFHNSPECGNCLTGHRISIDDVPAHLGFASNGGIEPNGAIISFVSGGNRYRLLMSFAEYTELNKEILAEVIGTFALTK